MNLTNRGSSLLPVQGNAALSTARDPARVYEAGEEIRIKTESEGPTQLVRVEILLVSSSFLRVMALHDFDTQQTGDGVQRTVKRGEQFWVTRDQVYTRRA